MQSVKACCGVRADARFIHTHTHTSNGPLSRTTWLSRYQKGKTNLDFTEARDSEWQWDHLGHMQVCTLLQTDNHANTSPLKFFYRPDALPAAQPTASKHRRHLLLHSYENTSTVANCKQQPYRQANYTQLKHNSAQCRPA